MTGTYDDDTLLDLLGTALEPPAAEPSGTELVAVHRAVAERRQQPAPIWVPAKPVRRTVVAITVVLGVLSGGTALAVGTGTPLPRPVRAAADAVGLPVDSVALADMRETMAELRRALRHQDGPAVADRADEVRRRLEDLDPTDRAAVIDEAERLLDAADAFLAPPPVITPPVVEPDNRGPGGGGDDDGDDNRGPGSGSDDVEVDDSDSSGPGSGEDVGEIDDSSGSGSGGTGSGGTDDSGSSGSGSGSGTSGSGRDDSGSGSGESGSSSSGSGSGSGGDG